MLKNSENNETEEIDLVTPTPGLLTHIKQSPVYWHMSWGPFADMD